MPVTIAHKSSVKMLQRLAIVAEEAAREVGIVTADGLSLARLDWVMVRGKTEQLTYVTFFDGQIINRWPEICG